MPATPNPFRPGNPLFPVFVVYTPRNAASGSLDYSIPVGDHGAALRLHLDAAYADQQYSFQAEPGRPTQFIVNGRLALADITMANDARVTISVWSRNLFNETHIYRRSGANGAVLGDYANFNAPRTFGAEVAFEF